MKGRTAVSPPSISLLFTEQTEEMNLCGLCLAGIIGMSAEDVAKMEIAAGKGTDILVYDHGYAQSNVSGGIMQDLNLYMDQDEMFRKDDYFTNILEAYKIADKQYVVPVSFRISTYVGKEKLVGEKDNWTVGELSDSFNSLGENAVLFPVTVSDVYETALVECLFEEEPVNYIGYPGVEGNGGMIENGSLVMGITINCKQPEMAWEFIKTFLEEDYQDKSREYLPIHRGALETWLKEAQEKEYKENGEEKIKDEMLFDGEESLWTTAITEEDAGQVLDLIENASTLSTWDEELRNIVYEEAVMYFEGDRTAEESVLRIVLLEKACEHDNYRDCALSCR